MTKINNSQNDHHKPNEQNIKLKTNEVQFEETYLTHFFEFI